MHRGQRSSERLSECLAFVITSVTPLPLCHLRLSSSHQHHRPSMTAGNQAPTASTCCSLPWMQQPAATPLQPSQQRPTHCQLQAGLRVLALLCCSSTGDRLPPRKLCTDLIRTPGPDTLAQSLSVRTAMAAAAAAAATAVAAAAAAAMVGTVVAHMGGTISHHF